MPMKVETLIIHKSENVAVHTTLLLSEKKKNIAKFVLMKNPLYEFNIFFNLKQTEYQYLSHQKSVC